MSETRLYTIKLTDDDIGVIVRALTTWAQWDVLQSESRLARVLAADLVKQTNHVDLARIITIQDKDAGL